MGVSLSSSIQERVVVVHIPQIMQSCGTDSCAPAQVPLAKNGSYLAT